MYKILFIDSLTTGKDPYSCAIYRLGGIFTVNGEEKLRFELRMRPHDTASIREESIWIGGETRTSLIYYQDQKEVFKQFIGLLDMYVDVHNASDKLFLAGFNTSQLEYPFLNNWFSRNRNKRFNDYFYKQPIDLMCISNFLFIKKRPYLVDYKMETAAKLFGLTVPAEKEINCINNAKVSLDMFRKAMRDCGIGDCQMLAPAEKSYKNF